MTEGTITRPAFRARLTVLRSPVPDLAGRSFPLEPRPCTLGRVDDCDITIPDPSVSRRHAELRPEGDRWVLEDLGSSNGTWIGEERIRRAALEDGSVFRIGATELRLELEPEPEPAPEPGREPGEAPPPADGGQPTRAAAGKTGEDAAPTWAPWARRRAPAVAVPAGEVATLEAVLRRRGRERKVSGNTPWVISGADTVWYVAEGRVELFTVALDANGEPRGARSHFLTADAGQLIFGMDFERYGLGAGILAVGRVGTTVVELPLAQVRVLAVDERFAREVAAMVERWVTGLCEAFVEPIAPGPSPDLVAGPEQEHELGNGQVARAQRGVVWIEPLAGELLFVGWENVRSERTGEDRGLADIFERAARLRALFPLTPDVWLEAANPDGSATRLRTHATRAVLAQPQMWTGLEAFHETLCRCEFINKRLALVDELNRLKSKAEYAEAARKAAVADIASVMAGPTTRGPEVEITGADPLLDACRLVGAAQGIEIRDHPEVDRHAPTEDRVAAIAKASRCRTRPVALRDEWWRYDQGPILGRWEESGSPVALLPKGPRAYEYVDTTTGERGRVDEQVAMLLSPFAMVSYRPFPDGPLTARDLIRFGVRGLRSDFLMLVAMGVALGMLGTVTPFFTGRLFDTAIPQADRGLLLQFTGGLFMAALVSSAFKITQAFALLRIEGKMDYSIQAALWDRLLNLPTNVFRRYTAGDMADRASGVDRIRKLVAGAGINSVLGSLSSIFYVFLMLKYSFKLTAVAMGLTGVFVGFTTTANYLKLRRERKEMSIRGKITGMVLQFISGVSKIRVAGAENHAFRVWARDYSRQRKLLFSMGQIENALEVFSSGFPVLSSMAIFYALMKIQEAAALRGVPPPLTTGDFIAFNAAFTAFLAATQSLGDASMDMLRAIPIFERLKPIVTEEPELDEARAYPGRLRGAIQVSHVSFRYAEDAPWILEDLSVEIRPGEFVAFVGPSGCGKSTLMRLLLGFETPQRGAIYFDGQDLASLDLREVRQQIGVVLQSSTLLPTDIYRNIVGSSGLPITAAWEAAELAGLAEDIRQLPMGMHTYISEGGGGLSGGQRQKVLIARALVHKPRILIFDEATSALDNRSQAVVTESMERLQATRIVIAHRLSTIINADRICYLEGGRVQEEGTFEELMELDGKFAALARRQMA